MKKTQNCSGMNEELNCVNLRFEQEDSLTSSSQSEKKAEIEKTQRKKGKRRAEIKGLGFKNGNYKYKKVNDECGVVPFSGLNEKQIIEKIDLLDPISLPIQTKRSMVKHYWTKEEVKINSSFFFSF